MPNFNLIPPANDGYYNEQEANTAAINKQLTNSNKQQEKTNDKLKKMKDELSSLIRVGTVVEPSLEEIDKEKRLQKSQAKLGYPLARVLVHIGKNNTGEGEKIEKICETDEANDRFNTESAHLTEFKEAAKIISSKTNKLDFNQCNEKDDDSNIRVWIQFTARNAGVDAEWAPPSYGEQVLILCNNGSIFDAYIIGSLYRNAINCQRIPSWVKKEQANSQDPFEETNFPTFIKDLEFPILNGKNHQKHLKVFGSSGLILFDPVKRIHLLYLFALVKDKTKADDYDVLKLFERTEQLIQEKEGSPAYGERIQKIFHSDSPKKSLVTEKTTIKRPEKALLSSLDGSVNPAEQTSSEVNVGSVSTKIYSSKVAGRGHSINEEPLATEELSVNSDLGGDRKTTLNRIDTNDQVGASFNNIASVTEEGVATRQESHANKDKNSRRLITESKALASGSLFCTRLESSSGANKTQALFQLESQKEGVIRLEAHSDDELFCKIELSPSNGLTISTSPTTSINICNDGKMTVNTSKIDINADQITVNAEVEITKKIKCSSGLEVKGELNVI